MKKSVYMLFGLLVITSMLFAACAPRRNPGAGC